tara:strand:- start:28113 stop:28862 length:750 start_codon:yes stop_codon:yes gene_type:complete
MGRAFEFRKARKLKRWSAVSKTFTKIGKEIYVAVKDSGADPETNSRLKQIIQNAKSANMPKENIDRAIKKASGENATNYIETTLEGYAPHGIAVFIDCTTDNNNRTVANIRSYFNKYGGNLGKNGSLDFLFERKGVFNIKSVNIKIDLEELEMELIDYGLDELETEEDLVIMYCKLKDFNTLQKKIENLNIIIESSELQRIANNLKTISDECTIEVLKLLESIEKDEDVQKLSHNMNIPQRIINLIEEK